jgi:murein DD-endopeptidase MepM/ murein hydrolase activator NlpD
MGESLIMLLWISSFKPLIILMLMSVSTCAFSAIGSSNVELNEDDGKENVFEMKRRIQDQNKQMLILSKEVNNVEVTLGLSNKKYLKLAEERNQIEERLSMAKKNADLDSDSLKKSYSQSKSLLMGVLLNKLENTENSSDLLARKIMITKLQERMRELETMMNANKNLRQEVDRLQLSLEESMSTEKELLSVMSELENKKKELRDTLTKEKESHEQLRLKLDEEKNKFALNKKSQLMAKEKEKLSPLQITEEIKIPSQNQKINFPVATGDEFYPPLYSFQGIEYEKKGVTFNFHGKKEVRATKAGKIVYTGALANYGNVLMIDHGNDSRTVLLGQFDYLVKNGDSVKLAQVVGYTAPKINSGLSEGKLYFEVRKSNLAQNTYMLIDKNSLAKYTSK